MRLLLPFLSAKTAGLYKTAGDFMKIGRWMMLTMDSAGTLEDYKKICGVKLAAKS